MSLTEILISIVGVLVGVVGYLLTRQFEKLDKIEGEFFDIKSDFLDSKIDKQSLVHEIEKINTEELTKEIIEIKEYQQFQIKPLLDKTVLMMRRLDMIQTNQDESDKKMVKMFEILKRTVDSINFLKKQIGDKDDKKPR